jgi:hypothetical protein
MLNANPQAAQSRGLRGPLAIAVDLHYGDTDEEIKTAIRKQILDPKRGCPSDDGNNLVSSCT